MDARLLAGDVVELRLRKPRRWSFEPGAYIFLRVDVISSYEWHPFTISSAPEDSYISLHIRVRGDWTRRQCH